MLSKALDKYNDTIHSSTNMKPKDAHGDKNHLDVRVYLTRKEKNTCKYQEVKVNDMVKVHENQKTTTQRGRSITQNGAINPTKSSR